MDTDKKTKRRDARPQRVAKNFFPLHVAAFSAPPRFSPSVFIRLHPWLNLFESPKKKSGLQFGRALPSSLHEAI
jgi:hypothetical protein